MYVTYCRVISKQVCLVTTNSTHNREYCDEVLKKKHNRYAQKQKQRVPTAEEQWLLTPSFRQNLWEAALHSLLSPHSPAERNPPCSSFQPCPMESTWAWPPSCAHRHKPSPQTGTLGFTVPMGQNKMSLPDHVDKDAKKHYPASVSKLLLL